MQNLVSGCDRPGVGGIDLRVVSTWKAEMLQAGRIPGVGVVGLGRVEEQLGAGALLRTIGEPAIAGAEGREADERQ